jgi:hypothetical protein
MTDAGFPGWAVLSAEENAETLMMQTVGTEKPRTHDRH